MNEVTMDRIRKAYAGKTGRYWSRIERERPATWLEQNAVRGRRQVRDRLLDRMQPLAGRRILDAGCGLGILSRRLAAQGALVTAGDLTGRFRRAGATEDSSPPTFVDGNFLDLLGTEAEAPRFDDIVLVEVLEDYTPSERSNLLRRLAVGGSPRIWLVFRVAASGAGRLWDLAPDPEVETIEAVELLRSIHTITPYRQRHGESLSCRNYSAHLSELVLDEDV